jgi:uncharacterized protein (DUF885 family)
LPDHFEHFVTDYHAYLARDPNTCINLGIDQRLGELPDPSAAAQERKARDARALLERLDALDPAALDFDQALDADLARLTLQARIHKATHTFNGRTRHAQLPSAGDDLGDGIFLQFVNDPREPADRLVTITSRMEAIPDYLEALLARLDTPVARWSAMELEKVAALPQLFDTLEAWASETSWEGSARLAAAGTAARTALQDYAARLASLPTTTQLHLAEQDARRIVELGGIDRSLEQLHAMARDFLAETGDIVNTLTGRLAKKYGLPASTTADELTLFMAEHFKVRLRDGRLEGILDRYELERGRIDAFIGERDLFPIPAGQDLKIMRTPGFMKPSIPAGAMMPPPPFRAGVRRSLVYLTLSEELAAEHTELSIPGMMIHEGIPGHHLQLATAAMHPSVIRRHYDGAHHAEGWTTMLEDYMLDMGYMGELTDEARFQGKRDISRIGARVAIDLFFMTGEKDFLDVGVACDLSSDDPFVAAGNLLAAVTGFVPERVQGELNWYSQERGYPLSYLTGNRMVWELKRDVERESGLSGLELDRRFHRLYLESGNMPVRFLRRVFQHEGLLRRSTLA